MYAYFYLKPRIYTIYLHMIFKQSVKTQCLYTIYLNTRSLHSLLNFNMPKMLHTFLLLLIIILLCLK